MWDMIYAFGIGISFAVGIGVGALLCRIATEKGRRELSDEMREYNDKVLGVLTERALNDQAMINALNKIADK